MDIHLQFTVYFIVCSVQKKFLGPKSFGWKIVIGPTNWFKKNSGSKNILGPEKCWVQQNFGSKKIGPQIFGSKKKLCIGSKKNLGLVSKTILGQKQFWVETNFGSKKFGEKKKFGP